MLKTGIFSLSQIQDNIDFKSIFGMDKRVSITLYDRILLHPKADQLAERILLMFTDERGTYKRTYANRFEQFDLEVISVLKKYYNQEDALQVQDVAVSDGRTAADFFTKVSNIFPFLEYQASDYNPSVYVIEEGKVKLTLSHNNKLIEIVWPPFVLNTVLPDRYWYEPLNRVIQFFVEKIVVAPMLKKFSEGGLQKREIFLFAPSALNLAKQDQRFKLLAHNLLMPFTTQSHIIRAMNILNPNYFSKTEFVTVVQNLYLGLQENGLLIVGSNQDSGSIVNGGVYQKSNGVFNKIMHSGSEPFIERHLLATIY